MFALRLGYFWRPLAESARRLRAWWERLKHRKASRRARGLVLLREWLSPTQKAQFDGGRYFDVVGCDSGARYRIHHGTAANVWQLDPTGEPALGLCFVPSGALVAGDVMLAQKIALETNERAAVAVANKFPVRSASLW
jgi:hypothetical protein